jgi:hypothetical protein
MMAKPFSTDIRRGDTFAATLVFDAEEMRSSKSVQAIAIPFIMTHPLQACHASASASDRRNTSFR